MRMAALTPEVVDRLVTIDNIEILDEARADGTGVLICTVHVGGMDMIGPALAQHGEALHVVADDTTYGSLYEHLKAVRAEHGLLLIGWRNSADLPRPASPRERRPVLRRRVPAWRRPGRVPGGGDHLSRGTRPLARTGAPMLPVYCQRTRDDGFRARGLPLIRCASEEPAEIYRATQALADELGGVIRDDPSQWYMFRPVWPQTDAERAHARAALEAARRGEDWTRLPA